MKGSTIPLIKSCRVNGGALSGNRVPRWNYRWAISSGSPLCIVLRMMSVTSNRICDGTGRKFKLIVTLEEVQLMFASWLNVSAIIDMDGEHFPVEIAKLPMYLG